MNDGELEEPVILEVLEAVGDNEGMRGGDNGMWAGRAAGVMAVDDGVRVDDGMAVEDGRAVDDGRAVAINATGYERRRRLARGSVMDLRGARDDELAAEQRCALGNELVAEPGEDTPPGVSRKVRTRTKRDRPRSKTFAMKRVTRAELQMGALLYPPVEGIERPRTRAECNQEARPCPWVSCKHHLYLDINPETGSIKINFPDLEPWEMTHTCSLDVADAGALTLEEIGSITNLTRERIRQVEVRGLLKLKARRELR